MRGNHFQHILPVDAHSKLGTLNWKCFAGTKLWAIGKLLREMRPDGMLCFLATPHFLRDACRLYSFWCIYIFLVYRAVYAQFSIPNILARRRSVHKKQTMWKNIDAAQFHSRVENNLRINVPTTLHDLEGILLRCQNDAKKSSSSSPTPEPWQIPSVQALLQERRGCRDKAQRAMLSKLIGKHLRANMRQKRNKRLNDILSEFRDLGNIASINEDPVRHQRKLTGAEPSKEDFTGTLSAIFSSDADSLPDVEANPGPTAFFDIQPFSLAEVRGAMFKMRCGRGADGDGLV